MSMLPALDKAVVSVEWTTDAGVPLASKFYVGKDHGVRSDLAKPLYTPDLTGERPRPREGSSPPLGKAGLRCFTRPSSPVRGAKDLGRRGSPRLGALHMPSLFFPLRVRGP